ncbi:SAM-dependent methyltransferase [Embleya sp. NPDC020630]|uniref:SAM-dependent methyltransferase n=1 Tax=Embleya sp. NPDC020630 TaxID=3363979 RepID=UPI0037B99810
MSRIPPTSRRFEEMYADSADPWQLGERAYDRRKYALTLAALPRERYRSAFEPACSVGVLTAELARRCDRLLACDLASVAVREARARTRELPGVTVECRRLPEQWPTRADAPGAVPFDLVVLSEFLYYFEPARLADVLARVRADLAPGGTLVAVHWRPAAEEHVLSAERVHAAVRALPGLVRVVEHREPDFLLDVLIRADAPADTLSPAAREGLR